MTLKADMARDINEVFLNEDDFAETRRVADRDILCVFYAEGRADGVDEYGVEAKPKHILQAATDDLPSVHAGETLRIDGDLWEVRDVREEYGMTSLQLTRRA